jgi:hypothetical protein
MPRTLILFTLLLACALDGATEAAESPSARSIVERAHEAAGGAAWRRPRTLHLIGSATLYQDGAYDKKSVADHYEMWREFPAWNTAAHTASGKVRIDAHAAGKVLFQTAFDGTHTYNQNGLVPNAQASREWSEAFGFGIIRFALDEGFSLARLADDQVEGIPCHVVRVSDPSGADTTFWIASTDASIRKVGFDTPRGWHERIYSDYFWHENPRFAQSGRVRLYYRGALTNDIRWHEVEVNRPIPAERFVITPKS